MSNEEVVLILTRYCNPFLSVVLYFFIDVTSARSSPTLFVLMGFSGPT